MNELEQIKKFIEEELCDYEDLEETAASKGDIEQARRWKMAQFAVNAILRRIKRLEEAKSKTP